MKSTQKLKPKSNVGGNVKGVPGSVHGLESSVGHLKPSNQHQSLHIVEDTVGGFHKGKLSKLTQFSLIHFNFHHSDDGVTIKIKAKVDTD